jgi:ketosteroid isomerase-like protein
MSYKEIIRNYFDTYFTGKARHSKVRDLLADDFVFRGPLMVADSADEYLEQLTAYGDELELYAEVRSLIQGGSQVAALVDFQGPGGIIPYAQWFTFQDDKIQRLEVIYDPRPFLG